MKAFKSQVDTHIFGRMLAVEPIRLYDAQCPDIQTVVDRTIKLNAKLDTSDDIYLTRKT